MPFTRHSTGTVGKAFLLSLCLFSCTPQLSPLPSLPSSEDGPHTDPARDAQSRLLREAYRAFDQERYQAAVLFLQRFVEGAPDSPRLAEARWWLGRAHEQLGDYRAAMAQYRAVASGQLQAQFQGPLYEEHALRRLDELRQLHADINGTRKQLALRLPLDQFPSGPSLSTWLQDLSQGGVTGFVVDALPGQGLGLPAFQKVAAVVTQAHSRGLLVWAVVDIHEPQGLDLRPEWLSVTVNGRTSDGLSITRPDIANPDYQVYLEETVRTLSRTGCDGLFFASRSRPGFAEEFSDDSFRLFKTSFGQELSPELVLGRANSDSSSGQERGEIYWRWAGWKAGTAAKLMARLRGVLRTGSPTAGLLVEVHEATLSSPLTGLEQYGEDVAELAQRTGGSIVVRRASRGPMAFVDKLERQLGTTDRVWVEFSRGTEIPLSAAALNKSFPEMSDHRSGHLLILPEPPAVP